MTTAPILGRFPWFVHIIESPRDDDLIESRLEGRVLSEALSLARIPHCYNLVTTEQSFYAALGRWLMDAIQTYRAYPILHFSMHGDADGVQLLDGNRFSWDELRGALRPVASHQPPVICMSSCQGLSGIRMAMQTGDRPAFMALVGNYGSPTWTDAAVAFIVFYHRFGNGAGIKASVDAMNAAVGNGQFHYYEGAEIKKDYEGRFINLLLSELKKFGEPPE